MKLSVTLPGCRRILQAEDKLAEVAMPEGFQKLLPNSLFSVTSDEHRASRRLLAPVSCLLMYCVLL